MYKLMLFLMVFVLSVSHICGQDMKQGRAFQKGFDENVLIEIVDNGAEGYFFFRNLSMPERILVYNFLPPDLQEKLWVNHLEQYVSERQELLSSEETTIIDELLSFIHEDQVFYLTLSDFKSDQSVQRSLISIQERLWDSFKLDTFEIIGILGGTPSGGELPNQIYMPCEDPHDCAPCSCFHGGTNYCIGHPRRCWYEMYCSPTETGCGTLWGYPCDGECGIQPDPTNIREGEDTP